MLFKSMGIILSTLSVSVYATTTTSTPTGTASAPVATKTFAVGAEGKTFSPRSHTANIGDIIEYRFYPLNHSVVKAAFGSNPCIPYELTGAGRVGWWSGFRPVNVVTSDPPIFRIRINDTEPLFVYCSAPGSCKQGMIAVVNPNATQSFEAQLAYTQNATAAFSPGEGFPEETDPEATKGPSKPTSAPDNDSGSHPHSLSAGAIAGIAIAGVAVLALAAGFIYMCGRHKSLKDILRHSRESKEPQSYQPTSPGLSEANYPNMAKSPAMTDARFSAMSYSGETFRSVSPPLDDRSRGNSGLVDVVMNGQQQQHGVHPHLGYGNPTPSPRYEERHEMDPSAVAEKGVRSVLSHLTHGYSPVPTQSEELVNTVHELPASPGHVEQSPVLGNSAFRSHGAEYARR